MHPVDEYAQLKSEIKRLQTRANELRDGFLSGEVLQSNVFIIEVREQARRILLRDCLPDEILQDPQYWEIRRSPIVRVLRVDGKKAF